MTALAVSVKISPTQPVAPATLWQHKDDIAVFGAARVCALPGGVPHAG